MALDAVHRPHESRFTIPAESPKAMMSSLRISRSRLFSGAPAESPDLFGAVEILRHAET